MVALVASFVIAPMAGRAAQPASENDTARFLDASLQNSQASLRELAVRYGINPKTVAKWRPA